MIFISHDSRSTREAEQFGRLVRKYPNRPDEMTARLFLSSDDSSIPSGELWVCHIFAKLKECEHFVSLIVDPRDYDNRWIPFEAAYAMGRKIEVNVFVFGQLQIEKIQPPLNHLHLIDTGKTGRVQSALSSIGVRWSEEMEREFAHLFRQCGCYRDPKEKCDFAVKDAGR